MESREWSLFAFRRQFFGILLVGVLVAVSGCSATRRPFQVDPCLVPDKASARVNAPTPFELFFGARYMPPLLESEILPADPLSISRAQRNDIMEHTIERCDQICDNHKKAFTSESLLSNLMFSITSIGLSAAGGLATGGAANVLSATSTATQGTEKAISKEVFADKVAVVLATKIDAEQAKQLTTIRELEAKEPADYSLWAGLRDVQRYHASCSLASGLALVQQDASNDKQESEKELAAVSVYGKDAGTEILRKFWKPDGKTIDRENEKALKASMAKSRLGDVSVTRFLYGSEFKSARVAVVKDLGLD